MVEIVFISENNRGRFLRIIKPVGNILSRMGVHPNVISIIGLALSIAAGFVYSRGAFFWAAWVVVLTGCCDALDGQLARETGKSNDLGAFLDSTLDRYGDLFILLGLAWLFSGGTVLWQDVGLKSTAFHSPWAVLFTIMAMFGSFMVSYTRARAEGIGLECRIGLMQRPERVTLLVIGSLLGAIPVVGLLLMKLALFLLAISSNITAIHRIVYIRNQSLRGNQAL